MDLNLPVPVVDVFAGPGGLSEGFASSHLLSDDPVPGPLFDPVLSVEKDDNAYSTLLLRHFYREFLPGSPPNEYFKLLQAELSQSELFERYPVEAETADSRVLRRELGKSEDVHDAVGSRISTALGDREDWVLVGGPPCQAYSLVGRARNKGIEDYDAAKDKRHFLYEEFLRIIADHWPPVFVFENVKGLLSATVDNQKIFSTMLKDLRAPGKAIDRSTSDRSHQYRVCSFVNGSNGQIDLLPDADVEGAIVRMEKYGIPQSRHRVLLMGIRDDLADTEPETLGQVGEQIAVAKVLDGLPPVRSGLSREEDTGANWRKRLRDMKDKEWFTPENFGSKAIYQRACDVLENLTVPSRQRGGEYVASSPNVDYRRDWFLDDKMNGVCNHTARGHMVSDLYRYLFAACYAEEEGTSPLLGDFPEELLPNHKSANKAVEERWHFSDRFRVQVSDSPASTVTSHISKDGHYFIHPDPEQCRSFTVREAARVQTFPDNYFFAGPRTSQFVQVGNAVPPLLSAKIARIVFDLLERS